MRPSVSSSSGGTVSPLKTLHETNLPVPATPFLGREREIDQIAALLRRPDVRLVTLAGPWQRQDAALAAGCRRGRRRLRPWRLVVPLASLADPALVDGRRSGAGSKDTLSATVGDKRLLLVLDNFEHLLEAAAGVADTIGSCPHLTVLVTSREPLHVDGEWKVAVDPLPEREAASCSCSVPWPWVPTLPQTARSPRSAGASTAAARDRTGCAREGSLAEVLLERLEQRLPLLPAALARHPSGSARCARRSPGATTR